MLSTESWQAGVLDPQGPIAEAQRTILLNATVVMLTVIGPVILTTLVFAWWFRAGNHRARRLPDWSFSGALEVVVWSVPMLVIVFLGGMAWIGSHQLDPRRSIAAEAAPLDIQVVSLDWKWLFIYPGQGVASVNRLVVPVGTPLRLQLTSAGVMNSFFVPQLGSQIYTMAGMETQLNLLAARAGRYPGLSAQFSGDGFSDMRFEVAAVAPADYDRWLGQARGAGAKPLDAAAYARLARPQIARVPEVFGAVTPGLFEALVANKGAAHASPSAGPGSIPASISAPQPQPAPRS